MSSLSPEALVESAPEVTDVNRLPFLKTLSILIALLIVLGVAEVASRVYNKTARPLHGHSVNFDQKYALLTQSPEELEKMDKLFLMGNSMVDQGIYTEQLAHNLKQHGTKEFEILNLGVRASDLHMTLFLIKQAVESKMKPQWVVLGLNPSHLSTLQGNNQIPILDSYIGRCKVYPPTSPGDKFNCLVADHSYLYRHRPALKEWFVSIPKYVFQDRPIQKNDSHQSMSTGGWSPAYRYFRRDEALQHIGPDNPLPNGLIRPKTRPDYQQLKKLVDYCKQENIRLVLLWMPVPRSTPNKAKMLKTLQSVQTLASQWHVPFLDMRDTPANEAYFMDFSHLNVTGAVYFTDKLSARLNQPEFDAFWAVPPQNQLAGKEAE